MRMIKKAGNVLFHVDKSDPKSIFLLQEVMGKLLRMGCMYSIGDESLRESAKLVIGKKK